MKTCDPISVIGGGLSGSEAAWQLASRGVPVRLYEMRPDKMTPAHTSSMLGELVCSNSFGGDQNTTPAGILKYELRRFNSLIMSCADESKVPAGNALAVDRELFARAISSKIETNPLIEVIREEVTDIPSGPAIIATGPLTSSALAEDLKTLTGNEFLSFYDAVAPIVALDSIDMRYAFRGNRYQTNSDYINCPMDEETYHVFWSELVGAETAERHEFEEDMRHFEGCLPVEVIAKRGEQTLLFGPMRPVGLSSSSDGQSYYSIVQLRQDNSEGTLYNIVGFQTNLKWGEQERVFRLIPALRNAEFVRKGVMHRNMFVCAPKVLDECLRIKGKEKLFLAGQISGVEGYLESTAMGLASALFMYASLVGLDMPRFPIDTAIGALINYLNTAMPETFQPMNVNLGIFPKLPGKKIFKRPLRCAAYAARAEASIEDFIKTNSELFQTLQ
ncbi:MAG: methylenetetrahydrofolate--tRNA-(uracil(54)-C(5))-methyltransferase (FADH(2)-oxidizing) TrmFO [Synergistaceae bacterium]|nr:methylenetetrahydrofolate--tRNA-(uracil(54)-C(5))-methyltransferase (FADH(2)-oxidizing) TrmFO [Synergistaceae bacterium]